MATLTGAIGTGSKWLLDRIVGALAATGVNPNFLTFLGLVVNFAAAAAFAVGHFRAGALIIFFAGFLDMLDGQVARRQNRVTAFGAFYDSTLDRYADIRGGGRGSHGGVGDGELRAGTSGIADSTVQGGIHGTAGTAGAADYWRLVQPHGPGVVGNRGGVDDHGDSSHRVHVARNPRRPCASGHPPFPLSFHF